MNADLARQSRPDTDTIKQLFAGVISRERWFPFPALAPCETELVNGMAAAIDRFLASHADDFRVWDRQSQFPATFLQALRDIGLFGLQVPESYGGLGLSNAAYARIMCQIGAHDSATALTLGAHSSIGVKGLLLFGTDAQRAQLLPPLASGEKIATFCLTESGAGSDTGAIRTRALRNADDSWTLNGEKVWITNGGIAGLHTVIARTDGPPGSATAFLVEAHWPGVCAGPAEDKMGVRASSTTAVSFSDVRIPANRVLGQPGKGFTIAKSILHHGRTGLGAGAVGAMKSLLRLASSQARARRQFGRTISQFGLVRQKIAQMSVACFAAESAVWMLAGAIDAGHHEFAAEAAIVKVFVSESLQQIAHDALQIAGGAGYMCDLPYERISRDARVLSIFEGTNDVLRLFVALSSCSARPRMPCGRIDAFPSDLHPSLRQASTIFVTAADTLASFIHTLNQTDDVPEDQLRDARIADIAIDLYVGLCVLSRADAQVRSGVGGDDAIAIAQAFTRQAGQRMATRLSALEDAPDLQLDRIAASALARDPFESRRH